MTDRKLITKNDTTKPKTKSLYGLDESKIIPVIFTDKTYKLITICEIKYEILQNSLTFVNFISDKVTGNICGILTVKY
jgi:hypothetical protein